MAARTPHPILSAAVSLDALLPAVAHADQDEARARDRRAREPFDAAADRFIREPGPAELVRQVADDRMSHGERTFAAGIAGLILITVGLMAATALRHFGVC